MKKILFIVLISFIYLFMFSQELPLIERDGNYIRVGKGYAFFNGDIWFTHFKGSPEEIGIQHVLLIDQMFKDDQFDETMARFDPFLQERHGFDKIIQKFENFYFKTKLYPMIKRNIPDEFLREMYSFASVAGIEEDIGPESIVMSNVFQEMMLIPFCTSMAFYNNATKNNNLIHARNLDFVGLDDLGLYNFVAVFEPDNGIPFITFIYPSHTGIMHAMNSEGVSVSMNYSITNAENMSLDGIPFTILLRKIVQYSKNIDEAIEIIKSSPRTIGLNITISDAKNNRAVVIEMASEKYQIREQENYIFTANRYNTDFMKKIQSGAWMHSKDREERLNMLIEKNFCYIDENIAASILRDKYTENDFIFGINNSGTMASVIFDSTNLIMYAAATDKYRTSADMKFNAFSLEKALNGEYAYLEDRSIDETKLSEFDKDWIKVKELFYKGLEINKNENMQTSLNYLADKYPNSETLLYMKGIYYLNEFELLQALKYFTKIIELDKIYFQTNLEDAYGFAGLILDTLGEREKAIEYYKILKNLVEKDKESPDSFVDSLMYKVSIVGIETPVILENLNPGYTIRNKYQESFFKKLFNAPKEFKSDLTHKYDIYNGFKINNIYILGYNKTDERILRNFISLDINEPFNTNQIRVIQSQINKSNVFARSKFVIVPIDDNQIDIFLRIEEGFGLYNDPVEFIFSTVFGAVFGDISFNYYNLFGKMINFGGKYNWKNNDYSAYIQFPLFNYINSIHLDSSNRNITNIDELSFITKHLNTYFKSKQTFFPNLHTEFAIGYEKGNIIEQRDYILEDFNYIYFATSLDYYSASKSNLTPYFNRLTFKNSNNFDINNNYDYLWNISLENRTHISLGNGFIFSLRNKFGIMNQNTPVHHHFIVGGNGHFEAYNNNINGVKYISTGIELKRLFENGFELFILADIGNVWDTINNWDFNTKYSSIGGGIRYKTPIGLILTIQYAIDPFNLDNSRIFFPIYQGF